MSWIPSLRILLRRLRWRLQRHAERRQLAELDTRLRRDIGADPLWIRQEIRKWWWED